MSSIDTLGFRAVGQGVRALVGLKKGRRAQTSSVACWGSGCPSRRECASRDSNAGPSAPEADALSS